MRDTPIRIATRGSQLALWQAHAVRDALLEAHPGVQVEVEIVHTTGDKILDVPLAKIGDRGLFTKELDEAILKRRADLAVHSLKDVPTRLPEGLVLAAISEREDPRDVLLLRPGVEGGIDSLPAGSRIGTSSLRRRSQLRERRPDLEVLDLRGNLNTRLAKLDSGEYEAIILAAAGVLRLGWRERISEWLSDGWLPAVGQGALAVVTRADAREVRRLLTVMHHTETAAAVTAERAFLAALEGGCQVPIAALATVEGETVTIDGLVSDLEGRRVLRGQSSASLAAAADAGIDLADRLVAGGAAVILDEVRRASGAPAVPAP